MRLSDYGQSPWQTVVENGYMQPPHDQTPAKSRKKAKKKDDGVFLHLVVGVVFLAFGLGMWNAGFATEYDGYVDSTGTIVSVDRHTSCSKRSDCSVVGTPTIEYTVDGEKITSQANISSSSYGDSDVGKQVRVKYDPSDPSNVAVADDAAFAGPIMKIFFGGFAGLGAVFTLVGLKDLLKKCLGLVAPL